MFCKASFSIAAGWDDYKEKSLAETISEHREILGVVDFNYTPGLPQLVLAKFTGGIRLTPQDHIEVIRGWVKVIGQKEEVSDLFVQEMKFEENGVAYWLAIQEPLIPYFEKEISKGDDVWLYVGWIGTTKEDWIFIVNEFDKFQHEKR